MRGLAFEAMIGCISSWISRAGQNPLAHLSAVVRLRPRQQTVLDPPLRQPFSERSILRAGLNAAATIRFNTARIAGTRVGQGREMHQPAEDTWAGGKARAAGFSRSCIAAMLQAEPDAIGFGAGFGHDTSATSPLNIRYGFARTAALRRHQQDKGSAHVVRGSRAAIGGVQMAKTVNSRAVASMTIHQYRRS